MQSDTVFADLNFKDAIMADFRKVKLESFLATVRKYMQLRGGMSQKDLAEKTDVGVSTMSRFLSQKSTELNPQLIAKITAKLDIPLHEMIDFVEEDFSERFVRLVKFYKDELNEGLEPNLNELDKVETKAPEKKEEGSKTEVKEKPAAEKGISKSDLSIREKLESLTPRQRAFMTEFLNLNLEERDLVVDVGNNLFQYFKMKGMNL